MLNRRQLIGAGAARAALESSRARGKTTSMVLPEVALTDGAETQVTPRPSYGPDNGSVVWLNGWTFPYRLNGNNEEFHLVAKQVRRDLANGMVAHLWACNGRSTGATIEAVERDRVRNTSRTSRLSSHPTPAPIRC